MPRFALYYAPQAGSPLATAAAMWLGRNHVNLHLDQLEPLELGRQRFHELTADPYHYGFHGTLKPPFRMRDGFTEQQLAVSIKNFCCARKSFFIQSLEVAWIGKFLCLRPAVFCKEIDKLAGNAVQEFDRFRAPMSVTEFEKRRENGLSPAQDALLVQWGYPYVLEEFRFHLTLSANIERQGERERLEKEAWRHFRQEHLVDIPVDGLSLFLEREGNPMTQQQFFPFNSKG